MEFSSSLSGEADTGVTNMDEHAIDWSSGISPGRQKKNADEEARAFKCPHCQNSWFAELRANRYEEASNPVGWQLPYLNNTNFPIYLCLKCKHVLVPAEDGSQAGRTWELHSQMTQAIDDGNKTS